MMMKQIVYKGLLNAYKMAVARNEASLLLSVEHELVFNK
jgi:hypothetical protein